jgi:hypothetical protein
MKLVLGIIVALVVGLLAWYFLGGTNNSNNSNIVQTENSQQDQFVNYLKKQCVAFENQINAIQKKDFLTNYQKQIVLLSDSIGLFKNWKGTISKIETSPGVTSDKITVLKLEIKIKLGDYRDITFVSNKIIENTTLDSNLLYGQLKNLRVGSSVYFDGFIAKNKDNEFDYRGYHLHDEDNICDPEINFYTVSVSPIKLTFANSANITKVTDIQFKTFKRMEESVKGKISSKELKNYLNEYKVEADPLMKSLVLDEKKYIYSLTESLGSQFQTH